MLVELEREVTEAGSAEDALQLLGRHEYDIVVSDLGLQACRARISVARFADDGQRLASCLRQDWTGGQNSTILREQHCFQNRMDSTSSLWRSTPSWTKTELGR
jgi:CheY-like chemotaxis protein